jgi:protocatechuate 3,4-dioxygenase beta subunit
VRRAAIVVTLVAAGCGGSAERKAAAPEEKATCAPTPGVYEGVPPSPDGTPSSVRLGPGMELKATKRNVAAGGIGKPLVVSGTVRDEGCAALAGATINVWQTNGEGRYGPLVGGHDKCCYLQGIVRTGRDGRYKLDTVLPKAYVGGGPPHIHLTAGHPDTEGLLTEVIFGPPGAPDVVAMPLSGVRDGLAELDIVLRR